MNKLPHHPNRLSFPNPIKPVKRATVLPSMMKPNVVAPPSAPTVQRVAGKPVAPPVYRPQPVPKVLQAKKSTTQRLPGQILRKPIAPTAYALATNRFVQSKAMAPPAYRLKQERIAPPNMAKAELALTRLIAPPAYRALPKLKIGSATLPVQRRTHSTVIPVPNGGLSARPFVRPDGDSATRANPFTKPAPERRLSFKTSFGVVQTMKMIGGRRVNPAREKAAPYKRQTKRQLNIEFDPKRKKKDNCDRPLISILVWDGDSRPGWQAVRSDGSPGGLNVIGPGIMCATCGGGLATQRDHDTRYRKYISDNAVLNTFCDGTCHWLGITRADAIFWSNDQANLTPLCDPCHVLKTQAEGNPPGDGGPTPVGACPNGPDAVPAACGGGAIAV